MPRIVDRAGQCKSGHALNSHSCILSSALISHHSKGTLELEFDRPPPRILDTISFDRWPPLVANYLGLKTSNQPVTVPWHRLYWFQTNTDFSTNHHQIPLSRRVWIPSNSIKFKRECYFGVSKYPTLLGIKTQEQLQSHANHVVVITNPLPKAQAR